MMQRNRRGNSNSLTKGPASVSTDASYKTALSSFSSYYTPPITIEAIDRAVSRSGLLSSLTRADNGDTASNKSDHVPFSSEWLKHLDSLNIIRPPLEELDWSGRGQHVEYDATEEDKIPLKSEKIIGHSNSAIVDSVQCRRVRLARKIIKTHRRLKKEEAVREVKHLESLQHFHIIHVAGTYTLKRDLAILLYPVADWNLEEFMDDAVAKHGQMSIVESTTLGDIKERMRGETLRFIGCLSNAIHFIHATNIKHMDIKPKNIFVRTLRRYTYSDDPRYKVYIADFGIARSYQSASDSETDSPTPFTRAYAAPEVALQDTRGFKADIFSLGCVFIEIMATLFSSNSRDLREQGLSKVRNSTGGICYHENIDPLNTWLNTVRSHLPSYYSKLNGWIAPGDSIDHLFDAFPKMVSVAPSDRPDSEWLARATRHLKCRGCDTGPEPFKTAFVSGA